jgi:hypothetical protein
MRKLIYSSMVSLDGFVARPDFVQPVILGEGIPFFPPLESVLNLQLVETRPFQSGVVYLRYLKE